MLNENAKKWVEALRSGKYQQGEGVLCRHNRYCCLGVACAVYIEAGNELATRVDANDKGEVRYGDESDVAGLPRVVADWLGINTTRGRLGHYRYGDRDNLAACNDSGRTFDQIANIIESEPPGLFKEAP